jgi:hypothetical protein
MKFVSGSRAGNARWTTRLRYITRPAWSLRAEQTATEERHTGKVALRPVEAGDKPHLHRIITDDEHEWHGRASSLGGRQYRRTVANDYGRPPPNQIGGEFRQSFRLIVRPALLDDDIASFDETFLA